MLVKGATGHQHIWYWLCRICKFLSYTRKNFNYLCHVSVDELHISFLFSSEKFCMYKIHQYVNNMKWFRYKKTLKPKIDHTDCFIFMGGTENFQHTACWYLISAKLFQHLQYFCFSDNILLLLNGSLWAPIFLFWHVPPGTCHGVDHTGWLNISRTPGHTTSLVAEVGKISDKIFPRDEFRWLLATWLFVQANIR